MKALLRNTVTIAFALGLVGPACAANDAQILVARSIPYKDNSVGNAAIRRECHWTFELTESIVKNSGKSVKATDADLTTLPGKTLQIVVIGAHSLGGGAYTGSKWGHIYGELREGDKLIGNFKFQRSTIRGFSACGALSQVAEALGEDVAEWLRTPTIDATIGELAAKPSPISSADSVNTSQ